MAVQLPRTCVDTTAAWDTASSSESTVAANLPSRPRECTAAQTDSTPSNTEDTPPPASRETAEQLVSPFFASPVKNPAPNVGDVRHVSEHAQKWSTSFLVPTAELTTIEEADKVVEVIPGRSVVAASRCFQRSVPSTSALAEDGALESSMESVEECYASDRLHVTPTANATRPAEQPVPAATHADAEAAVEDQNEQNCHSPIQPIKMKEGSGPAGVTATRVSSSLSVDSSYTSGSSARAGAAVVRMRVCSCASGIEETASDVLPRASPRDTRRPAVSSVAEPPTPYIGVVESLETANQTVETVDSFELRIDDLEDGESVLSASVTACSKESSTYSHRRTPEDEVADVAEATAPHDAVIHADDKAPSHEAIAARPVASRIPAAAAGSSHAPTVQRTLTFQHADRTDDSCETPIAMQFTTALTVPLCSAETTVQTDESACEVRREVEAVAATDPSRDDATAAVLRQLNPRTAYSPHDRLPPLRDGLHWPPTPVSRSRRLMELSSTTNATLSQHPVDHEATAPASVSEAWADHDMPPHAARHTLTSAPAGAMPQPRGDASFNPRETDAPMVGHRQATTEEREEWFVDVQRRLQKCVMDALEVAPLLRLEAAARAAIYAEAERSARCLRCSASCAAIEEDIEQMRAAALQRALTIEGEAKARREGFLERQEAEERAELHTMLLLGVAGIIRQADAQQHRLSIKAREALEDLVYAENVKREGLRIAEVRARAFLYESAAGLPRRPMQKSSSSRTGGTCNGADEFFEWDPTHNTSTSKTSRHGVHSASVSVTSPSPQVRSSLNLTSSGSSLALPPNAEFERAEQQAAAVRRRQLTQRSQESKRSSTVMADNGVSHGTRMRETLRAAAEQRQRSRHDPLPRRKARSRIQARTASSQPTNVSTLSRSHPLPDGGKDADGAVTPSPPRTEPLATGGQLSVLPVSGSDYSRRPANRHIVPCSLTSLPCTHYDAVMDQLGGKKRLPPSFPASPLHMHSRSRPVREGRPYRDGIVYATDPQLPPMIPEEEEEDARSIEEVCDSPAYYHYDTNEGCLFDDLTTYSHPDDTGARPVVGTAVASSVEEDGTESPSAPSIPHTSEPPLVAYPAHPLEDDHDESYWHVARTVQYSDGDEAPAASTSLPRRQPQHPPPSHGSPDSWLVDAVTLSPASHDMTVSPTTVRTFSPQSLPPRGRHCRRSSSSAGYMAPTAASMRLQQETALARLLKYGPHPLHAQRPQPTPTRRAAQSRTGSSSRNGLQCSQSRQLYYGTDDPQANHVLVTHLPVDAGSVWSPTPEPCHPYSATLTPRTLHGRMTATTRQSPRGAYPLNQRCLSPMHKPTTALLGNAFTEETARPGGVEHHLRFRQPATHGALRTRPPTPQYSYAGTYHKRMVGAALRSRCAATNRGPPPVTVTEGKADSFYSSAPSYSWANMRQAVSPAPPCSTDDPPEVMVRRVRAR